MKSLLILAGLGIALNASRASASLQRSSSEDAGLAGNYLYSVSPGGRPFAMGKTSMGTWDATSGYLNPAGLSSLVSKEVAFLFTSLGEDISYNYLAFAFPFREQFTFGFSWISYRVGGGEQTDSSGNILGSLEESQNAYYLSSSFAFNPNVAFGGSVKIVNQSLAGFYDSSFGADIGAAFRPVTWDSPAWRNLKLAATLQNILAPGITLREETDKFPTNFVLGGSYFIPRWKLNIAAQAEMLDLFSKEGSSPKRWHLGAEYKALPWASMRAGTDTQDVTFGLGFAVRGFSLDYGSGLHELGMRHSVAITTQFGMLATVQEKKIAEEKVVLGLEKGYQNALTLFNARKYAEAVEACQNVLKAFPDDQGTVKLMGKARIQHQRQQAFNLGEKALDLYEQGKAEEGKKLMDEARALDDTIKERLLAYHLKKAEEKIETNQYRGAHQDLTRAIILDPANEKARDLIEKLKGIMEIMGQ